MKIGTKSLLFGYHQFLLHPICVAMAWWKLYGFPWDPRLWVAFFVHDIGYWGKPNMDGPEGEMHPVVGANIMHWLFDRPRIKRYTLRNGGRARDYNYQWLHFTLFHSRFFAKGASQPHSKLCVADKYVILALPWWIQLPLMNLTGEIHEYMRGQNGRTPGEGMTQRRWIDEVRKVLVRFIEESKFDEWWKELKQTAEPQYGLLPEISRRDWKDYYLAGFTPQEAVNEDLTYI